MNKILREDIEEIAERSNGLVKDFSNKTFLVTGATGLIGSLVVRSLSEMAKRNETAIKIIITSRDKERARAAFEGVDIVVYNNDEPIVEDVDYIVHCAAPTQSKVYTEEPVETMDAVILGTRKMLELAREKQVEKFLYLSSMEACGTVVEEKKVAEEDLGYIPLNSTRSSYSEGKRAAELYTYAFSQEYGVPAVNARLAMCFGAGLKKEDHRVHKSFCEDALNGRDIVMKSTGETVVNFVYSVDAVVAILTLLVRGESGETYIVSGDSGGRTIADMAKMVAEKGGVGVKQEITEGNKIFAPDNKMILVADKMKKLGWEPAYDLEKALKRLMEYLKNEEMGEQN